ncbi:TnsA endonuclease N-terminal domain-containing protein [Anoxybacillus rupiensis]|uniref:TnsA endonuclease N-terminal domain-containing protein n=1 Tax=Anoxybacteroides rupiense TaxID=311460 RepID=A0ABD5IXS0_9BACL|nr:TnsA endonuclease N-terminal domain-containing protein [Anoxybacillus rupiensis]
MSKRKIGWTEGKIARYYKEGRGQGELSNYKPWLTIQDVPSDGRAHRVKGWTTNRIHHLLSDMEYNYFCLLDWADEVIDIREQFPLSRDITLSIAEEKSIRHPIDSATQTPIVMTTDFLITVHKEKEIIYFARTVKETKELDSSRVIEKFEIEREYWVKQGVDWGIVTEKELPKDAIDNIKWLYSAYFLSDDLDKKLLHSLYETLSQNSMPILQLLQKFDETFNLANGSALSMFKYMLAHKIIKTNITKKIDLMSNTTVLEFPPNFITEKRWAN